MRKTRMQFKGALFYLGTVFSVNILLIAINSYVQSETFLFIGNLVSISLIFPAIALYVDRKEKFTIKRYAYFSIVTLAAMFLICELFIYQF